MSELSGERNIMIGGLADGLTPQQIRERFDELVDFAGIGDFVNLPMKTYSSGMGARLRFAISSAARPDVLLIDEALGTGAAEFRAKSKERIDRIRDDAGTIFLVSPLLGQHSSDV
jgi:teichoic acid transport system ATP-binding protein